VSPPSDRAQVEFLTHIQRLLSEGGFTASYKFALLLALADIAVEMGDDSGAPLQVPLDAIAERFIRLYWRQVVPHPAGHVLQQNTGSQAVIINLVEAARARYGSLPLIMRERRAWSALVRKVATVVKRMPLHKLQTLGAEKLEFLYRNEVVGGGIMLHPGVCFCLRRFHSLIEDLVQGAWIRFVRSLPANRGILGESADIAAFLFGSERTDLSIAAPVLLDLQHGSCFYCGTNIGGKRMAVDHFVPWSRYPTDLAHNFVLVDERCNNAKRDMLAAVAHLERWCLRNEEHGPQLGMLFGERGLFHDLAASYRVTSWAYTSAEHAHAQVWLAQKEVVPLDGEWRAVMGVAAP
jgi:HNH endonuclease